MKFTTSNDTCFCPLRRERKKTDDGCVSDADNAFADDRLKEGA
ncbi:hypothetical protein METH_06680 [Leisingera methylohalidivorans DSM 14336]|uniref:Uncharacterized protein n=1 Tax=Leisingera methylohalidivorans DSM 14336 TaxID=999552 RepID=V9VYA6_9RHOB|nr:hypothetical protein METH_06680 [Leisingera methylohalidivorans DSM 14336]